jgi:hypothetical protein
MNNQPPDTTTDANPDLGERIAHDLGLLAAAR